jgi:hypothetical protein
MLNNCLNIVFTAKNSINICGKWYQNNSEIFLFSTFDLNFKVILRRFGLFWTLNVYYFFYYFKGALSVIWAYFKKFSLFSCTHYNIPGKSTKSRTDDWFYQLFIMGVVIVTIHKVKAVFSNEIVIVALLLYLHT